MKNEIVKAEEFGIEQSKANELTIGLTVPLQERKLLIDEFNTVTDLDITKSNLPKFKALRLKIVKNRTQGIAKWHKANKDFFLTGGRFVDAIKNKEIQINESMESVLMNAEKHFENLEKERIEKLQLERAGQLLAFEVENVPQNLGSMDDAMWSAYVIGIETTFKAKLEAERKAELERLEAEKLAKAEAKKEAARIEDQRLENERLKKEAEEKEAARVKVEKLQKAKEAKIKAESDAKIKAANDIKEKEIADLKAKQEAKEKAAREERERLAKIEAQKQAKIKADLEAEIENRRVLAVEFLLGNGFKNAHGGMEAKGYGHFIGALHYSDLRTDNEFESFKSNVLKTKEAETAKAKQKVLEAELKAKNEAELKAKRLQEAKEKAAKMAPEKDKLKAFASMLLSLDIPDVKTDEAKKIIANVNGLLKKINGYILENVNKL